MTAWQIAIETSGRPGSVALLRQDELVEQIVLPESGGTARTLAPAIQQLVRRVRREENRLAFISVGVGPGSFTGLRIGVTAGNSLAYALRCRVAACDCLAAIIRQNRRRDPSATQYEAVTNAYRGQVFARTESAAGDVLEESRAVDLDRWLAALPGPPRLVAGDILTRFDPAAGGPRLPENVRFGPPELWKPTASEVGRMGWRIFSEGHTLDPFAVRPLYLRESAAVEKHQQEQRKP